MNPHLIPVIRPHWGRWGNTLIGALLSIPMKQLSRSIVFLNINTPDQRIGLLKPFHCLEAMDDSNEDIFQKSLLDRYVHRPQELEEMSYAEFGANYTVLYSNENMTVYLQIMGIPQFHFKEKKAN